MALGDLNASLAKLIALNSPKGVKKWVEPFGDGGTMAVYLAKKKPKEHLLNIVDEELFAVFIFVQSATSGQLKALKKMDWTGSHEAFDKAQAVTAVEGLDFFYKFQYVKTFGTKGADSEAPKIFDILKTGEDGSKHLRSLPITRVGLKKVTIVNEDPFLVMGAAGGSFLILLPKTPEDTEAIKSRLAGISSPYFFAGKEKDSQAIVDLAKQMPNQNVKDFAAASIMINTLGIVWNYESRLEPLSEEVLNASGTV